MPEEKWKSSTGRPYRDNRVWNKYNEELVVRGEFLLDLDWIHSWDAELLKMNEGKKGRPYEFPESLIELQGVWNQWVGLRQVEGITRKLVEVAKVPKFDDYTTASRRIRKLKTKFSLPTEAFCSVGTDGSGIKMHQAGDYRMLKYGNKKRRWIKVTITANPFTQDIYDVDVSLDGEGLSEPDVAMKHMRRLWDLGYTIDKFWGDGAFDVIALYNLLEEHGTESAIPPRDNASRNANGSMRRLLEVFDYQTQHWADWARKKCYGYRWLATEVRFSAVKRVMGENTRAKTPENACLEAKRKFWVYERMRQYAKMH